MREAVGHRSARDEGRGMAVPPFAQLVVVNILIKHRIDLCGQFGVDDGVQTAIDRHVACGNHQNRAVSGSGGRDLLGTEYNGRGTAVSARWFPPLLQRSEERRVGKEGRSRWSPYH